MKSFNSVRSALENRGEAVSGSAQYHNGLSATKAGDPERLVWFGPCLYWTDDWSKVDVSPLGIPMCPVCKAPGYQTTHAKWMADARRFAEETSQPAYPMWLVSMKETCSPDTSQWRPKEAKRA